MNYTFLRFALMAMLSVLFACSSDDDDSTVATTTEDSSTSTSTSGDETVTGLVMPENMSIVPAQEDTDGSVGVSANLSGTAFDDAGTDYSSDKTQTYVYDRSMQVLGTVNMILCLLDQTAATDMVNQGPYIALVNEDKCEQGQNQSSGGSTGQASGGQATQYNSWTIDSTREDNSSPQEVEIWVPGDSSTEGGDPMASQTIIINVTITEGATEEDPFGSFEMDFKGVVDGSLMGSTEGSDVEVMHGVLKTVDNSDGKLQFSLYNVGGDLNDSSLDVGFGFEEAVNVVMDDADGTAGSAITSNREQFNDPEAGTVDQGASFAIGFDTQGLHRGVDMDGDDSMDEQVCLSRQNFNTQVWRYNLYHQADGTFNGADVVEGERVKLNSGFPIRYDSDDNGTNDAYGYAGYHGVWTETGAISDGQTVVQFDYETDTETEHTVNVSDGRLIRRSTETESLTTFQGDEFLYWGEHPSLGMFGEWLVIVDQNNEFQLTHYVEFDETGMTRSETVDHDDDPNTDPVAVAATMTPSQDGEALWLWSDALGGDVVYTHDTSVLADNRKVTFYGEEFIFPGDSEVFANGNTVTLYCYDRCLQGGLTQADVDAAGSEMDLFYAYEGTPFQYEMSSANGKLVLTDHNGQAVSAVGLDLSKLGNDWGINTGDMVTNQLANPLEPWRVHEEDVTYRWETGNNEWNQTVTISDIDGNVMTFDKPLRFVYAHSTGNDANGNSQYDGKKFQLEYNGPGDLHGFPWVEDTENQRWYSAVTLANGTQLTDANGNDFVVKAIEREQTMKQDADGCSTLDISGLLSDPDFALPDSDGLNEISTTRADKPTVDEAPAVIEGELQN